MEKADWRTTVGAPTAKRLDDVCHALARCDGLPCEWRAGEGV